MLLLVDVFENFRTTCMEHYGLDPTHYYTSPDLSWDALLKYTGIELELFTDRNMHLFVEKGRHYCKANNPYLEDYNQDKEASYIMNLDANNLYGWAMSQHLPVGNFAWSRVFPTEHQIRKWFPTRKWGYIFEVDLEYPEELHDKHNAYFLAQEKKAWMKRHG